MTVAHAAAKGMERIGSTGGVSLLLVSLMERPNGLRAQPVVLLIIAFSSAAIVRISTIGSFITTATTAVTVVVEMVTTAAAAAATVGGRPVQGIEAGLTMSGARPGLSLVRIILVIRTIIAVSRRRRSGTASPRSTINMLMLICILL